MHIHIYIYRSYLRLYRSIGGFMDITPGVENEMHVGMHPGP